MIRLLWIATHCDLRMRQLIWLPHLKLRPIRDCDDYGEICGVSFYWYGIEIWYPSGLERAYMERNAAWDYRVDLSDEPF